MKQLFFSLYHTFDELVLRRLPARVRILIASLALGVARSFLPRDQLPADAGAMLNRRRVQREACGTIPMGTGIKLEVARHLARFPSSEIRSILDVRELKNVSVPVGWDQAGLVLRELLSEFGKQRFDLVVVTPWLASGGADLAVIHHVHAASRLGLRVALILTEDKENPWVERLPQNAHVIELGRMTRGLRPDLGETEAVLSRFLLQTKPSTIHNINSRLCWRCFHHHGIALSEQSRIFASAYADEISADGTATGYIQEFLTDCLGCLDGILTDNTLSAARWKAQFPAFESRIHVLHLPAPVLPVVSPSEGMNRVLWASRPSPEKRPELLFKLAASMPSIQWDIHGSWPAVPSMQAIRKSLSALPNVTLHGAYERFEDTVRPDHIALVYTSAWDGMPNVVLEAVASGLPVVALDVGGISDLIPHKELVEPGSEMEAKMRDMIAALKDPAWRRHVVARQSAGLGRFTVERFTTSLCRLPGYVGNGRNSVDTEHLPEMD